MSARSKSRKRALDVLYAADSRDVDPLTLLGERAEAPEYAAMGEYAETLVRGVAEHRRRINALLSQHAEGWTLAARMPAVDQAILRIAVRADLVARRAAGGGRRRSRRAGEVAVHGRLAALRQRGAGPDRGHRAVAARLTAALLRRPGLSARRRPATRPTRYRPAAPTNGPAAR